MNHPRTRPSARLAVIAIAAAIGLGACGGGGLSAPDAGQAHSGGEPESAAGVASENDDFAAALDEAIDRGLGLTDVFGSPDAGVDRDTTGESDSPVLDGDAFGEGMPAVLKAMEAAGAPATVLDVIVNPDVAVLTALDPAHPGQVLTWTWQLGTVERAGPQEPSVRYFADRPFPLDSVDWSTLPVLIDHAAARTEQDVDAITQVAVNRNTITGDQVVIRLLIPTPSSDRSIDVAVDGSIVQAYL